MTDFLGYALYFATLTGFGYLLAVYMARVYVGEGTFLSPLVVPVERLFYGASGIKADKPQGWAAYAMAVLALNAAGFAVLYVILRLQAVLPLNPDRIGAISPDLAFNTAISFVTNTDWQAYSGEAQLSYFSQMAGLTVQNFLSAGTGMAVAVAVIRGFAGPKGASLGNFWVDLTRSVLYILLPLSILLIPVAFCFLFGRMVGDRRQGWAIFAAMAVMSVAGLAVIHFSEAAGNPLPGIGANMEGKEQRFGATLSTMWAAATTAASNGSVNALHDSFMPLSGLVMLIFMQVGAVIFGGVGSGLYGMLLYVVLAVFLAGLMVGRTPEYLGRKIEGREVTLVVIAFLSMPLGILVGGAIAATVPAALTSVQDVGPHGLSEILYAYRLCCTIRPEVELPLPLDRAIPRVAFAACRAL